MHRLRYNLWREEEGMVMSTVLLHWDGARGDPCTSLICGLAPLTRITNEPLLVTIREGQLVGIGEYVYVCIEFGPVPSICVWHRI